jgi:cell division protein FtsW
MSKQDLIAAIADAAGITKRAAADALQAVINIGVSIGALPTKGLSLPFISYGGSALMANMVALGLLLNIARIPSAEPNPTPWSSPI